MASVLDNPVWSALTGPHSVFAEGGDLGRRYLPLTSPFAGLLMDALVADAQRPAPSGAWAELHAVAGDRATVLLTEQPQQVPTGWDIEASIPGVQMIATAQLGGEPEAEAVILGAADVPEMLELVERTRPGPFLSNTYQLGTYRGLRSQGRLIAMAGERMHPPGWTEISAVCTDSGFRGMGLARRLVSAAAHTIRQRGETPFLHAAGSNVNAIRLYQAMGFEIRRDVTFTLLRTP
jgi:ribosomal protein S18 acetylase RimI-like enzyme